MTTLLPADAAPQIDSAHIFDRKGREIPVRVSEIADPRGRGHVLVFGEPGDGCLVRIHSRCLYGESLGSDDCDCGPELDKTLDLMAAEGSGVLVYLEQEGRGLDLIAKARGYNYSEKFGTDTFASYLALGYPDDARTYEHAASHLRDLGLSSVQLLTNNPAKVEAVRGADIEVTVVPLATVVRSERARQYLEAKRRHRKHWIPTEQAPWALESLPSSKTTAAQPDRRSTSRRRDAEVIALPVILTVVVIAVVTSHPVAAVLTSCGGLLLSAGRVSMRALRPVLRRRRPVIRGAD